jgi:hypothetical protein
MKHLVFSSILLFLFVKASSQQAKYPYTINENTKLYEFSETIKTDKTAEELTHLAFNWIIGFKSTQFIRKIQEGFENSETVNWKDDNGRHNILTTKNFITRGGGNIVVQVNYTVKIQVQDNAYKFTITHIRYKHTIRTLNNRKCFNYYSPLENDKPICSGFEKSLKFSHNLIKKRTLIQVNEIIENLKTHMALKLDTWKSN